MASTTLAPGVWGIVATPFIGPELRVDHESLANLVGRYEALGATGLTVLGVFGEAARLNTAERAAVLATVAEATTIPLVAGATSLSTKPVIEEVQLAQSVLGNRMAGAMVQINTADPRALQDHLSEIHDTTGAGIIVQDYPVASGVTIGLDAQIAALTNTPGAIAIKAEAAPTAARVAVLASSLDLPVFGGLGGIGLLDELAAGAAGAMTGFSYPEGLIATVRAYSEGGYDAARAALSPYLPLINFEQQPAIALAIRKICLAHRGLISEAGVRRPAPGMPEVLRAQLERHLAATEAHLSAL